MAMVDYGYACALCSALRTFGRRSGKFRDDLVLPALPVRACTTGSIEVGDQGVDRKSRQAAIVKSDSDVAEKVETLLGATAADHLGLTCRSS